MPKEHKKRGRRELQKRQWEEEYGDGQGAKRQKFQTVEDNVEIIADGKAENGGNYKHDAPLMSTELPFYGLLDEEEQEYFRRADSILEVNEFGDTAERDLFLMNIYKEANGKELKIANSQSCSRLMERLILLTSHEQLKAIFQKFSGHFLNLVQHRFGSHCCEALFLRAAPIVTQELTSTSSRPDIDPHVSMEDLFLSTVNELEPNFGYFMSDLFASHPLRVLLLVLSGMPLAASNITVTLQSKRKENVSVANHPTALREGSTPRTVPSSFHSAVDKILARTLAGLDTTYLRALATQPIANPVLQILLELELTRSGKQSAKDPKSLFCRLLPDDPLAEGTDSALFIQHILYDAVGSRLLEIILTHAPGKFFKALYRGVLKDKLGKIVKNEIAAFVVVKLIQRLSKDDLGSAIEQILPHFDILIKRSRSAVIKTLIERCRAREVDTQPIADALRHLYLEGISENLIAMLQITSADTDLMPPERKEQLENKDVGKIHASLLVQTMLEAPGPLRELVDESLLTFEPSDLKSIARDRIASRVVQAALTCREQSLKFRRIFVQRFVSLVPELATDAVASHVIDALWDGSAGLKFLRERIADEMMNSEAMLRESIPGRAVWRNWKMDSYLGRRKEWSEDTKNQRPLAKTGIQLARERHAIRFATRQQSSARRSPSHRRTQTEKEGNK